MVAPSIGMLAPKLYKPRSYKADGVKYYMSNGVIYEKIKTPQGKRYQVVGYS